MPLPGKEFGCKILEFSVYTRSRFRLGIDMDYVSNSVFDEILTLVLEERFPEIEHQKKALLAVINRKDVFALLQFKQ